MNARASKRYGGPAEALARPMRLSCRLRACPWVGCGHARHRKRRSVAREQQRRSMIACESESSERERIRMRDVGHMWLREAG
jgi:hypothetical protein